MSTFQELQNDVLNKFGANDAEFTTEVQRSINEIIADLNAQNPRAPHLELTDTSATTTIGSTTVTSGLPADFDHQLDLALMIDSKLQPPLTYIDPRDWNDARLFEQNNTFPTHYTIWNNALLVGPPPDKAYPVTLNYYAFDTELTTNAQTCKLTDRYPRWEYVIIQGAVSKMQQYLATDERAIDRDLALYEQYKAQFRAWGRRNIDKRPESGRVKAWYEKKRRVNPLIPRELRRFG